MKNFQEVQQFIEGFQQPEGLNDYAWNRAKNTAIEVWNSYLNGLKYTRPLNFFCNEFYQMITDANGKLIVPSGKIRRYAA